MLPRLDSAFPLKSFRATFICLAKIGQSGILDIGADCQGCK